MFMRVPRPALTLGLVLASSLSVPAQQPPAPPAFSARTDLVLVDFIVNDKAERPITGLTAADLIVKEDGKERPIVSFAAFGGAAPAAAGAGAIAPLPAASATVIIVDDVHLTPLQAMRLRSDIKALLAKISEGSGSVALIAPASDVWEARSLPTGAAALASSVDQIVGHFITDHSDLPMSDAEAIAVMRNDYSTVKRLEARVIALEPAMSAQPGMVDTMVRGRATELAAAARQRRELVYRVALRSFDWLGDQPGRHGLVLVSSGFARDPDDPAYAEIVTRSLKVNAPVHFVDARGLEGFSRFQDIGFGPALTPATGEAPLAWSNAAEGTSVLADDTGGINVHNTNEFSKGLGRILETMRTYYVLGYEAPAHAKQGFHRIQVEARAKGANVRARRGYYDTKQGGR